MFLMTLSELTVQKIESRIGLYPDMIEKRHLYTVYNDI